MGGSTRARTAPEDEDEQNNGTELVETVETVELQNAPPTTPVATPTIVTTAGILALLTFLVQHALGALLVRYTLTRLTTVYDSTVAVLCQELVVKLPASFALLALERRENPIRILVFVARDARHEWREWLKMSVPAIIYTIQMNLLYVGYGNLEGAIGQGIYQSKIVFTAVFTRILLRRKLEVAQWVGVVVLMAGVVCVEHTDVATDGSKQTGRAGQLPVVGAIALASAALCSAAASVFTEKMLKQTARAAPPSLWFLNIQLAIFGSVVAVATVVVHRRMGAEVLKLSESWFAGFTPLVWLSIVWQAAGGLVVALTLKYADSVLRCFAQAGSILLVFAVSAAFLQFEPTPLFAIGTTLIVVSIFMYGSNLHKRLEKACMPKGMRRLVDEHSGENGENGASATGSNYQSRGAKRRTLLMLCATFVASTTLGAVTVGPLLSRAPAPPAPPAPPLPPQYLSPQIPPTAPPSTPSPPATPQSVSSRSTPSLPLPMPPPRLSPQLPAQSSPMSPTPPPQPLEDLCAAHLDEWCRSAAAHCPLEMHETFVARLDTGSDHRWRCFDPLCWDFDSGASVPGCTLYCTRHDQLAYEHHRCMGGRFLVERRAAPARLETRMVHMHRDGWKFRRFQTSITDLGLDYERLNIRIWPGVNVHETPEIMDWALRERLMHTPTKLDGKYGDMGAALAHMTLWYNISLLADDDANDDLIFMILEDNAIWRRESQRYVDLFRTLRFDWLNIAVLRPTGSPTDIPDLLRMPNKEPYPHAPMFDIMHTWRPPNIWLSTYMITPKGAKRLLDELRRVQCDMSLLVIDQCGARVIHSSQDFVGYVSTIHAFFHQQTGHDSRLELNTG